MSPSTRFGGTRGIKAKSVSKVADAVRPSTPLSAKTADQTGDTPKNVDAPKVVDTPNTRSAARRNAAAKTTTSTDLTITTKPKSASKLPSASTPSSTANPSTPSSNNSASSTDSASRNVTHSKEITDAVTALSRELEIPINLSRRERDQKAINEVMSIYLEHGVNWDHQTRIGFAKVLSKVKATASSEHITSNHAIWRAVTQRSHGWNWGYWIAFRTVYGKDFLQSRVRGIKIRTIQASFPGTDIWSAMTPAGVTRTKLETPTPEPITQTPTKTKTSFSIPKLYERKRPHPDIVTEGTTDRRGSLRAKKHRRYTPMTDREFLSLTTSGAPSPGEPEVLSPPASSVAAQDGEENLAGQSVKSPVPEADVNSAAVQSIVARPVLGSEVLTKREENLIVGNTTANNATANNATANNANQDRGDTAIGGGAAQPNGEWDDEVKRESMFQQLKRELSIQVANQVQDAELRTRQRIADLPRPSTFVNECINQIFADMLDIKQRLSVLEDDNAARNRNAAIFNIPSGLSGDSMQRSLETLGRQVQNCTRDIYQLKTNQPYEEDPILSHIKREPIQPSDSEMEDY
ncbi:hypothetical protein EDB81DRAFT_756664 [Dactylonectria macrodidyma]|uniref:Uncharacterized protein n=1 Tax=Dactylonectria macrodidyma TaxID=307937 RepID=A0A9P9FAA2_9HYPO|nr:hypothetical protein EDB81DRAFT_756664 [Dactylonectria macrodidyma]